MIYILCTKGRSPVYLGSSFAFIAPIAAAYAKGGISGAMTGIMAVGLIYVIFAIIIASILLLMPVHMPKSVKILKTLEGYRLLNFQMNRTFVFIFQNVKQFLLLSDSMLEMYM